MHFYNLFFLCMACSFQQSIIYSLISDSISLETLLSGHILIIFNISKLNLKNSVNDDI